MGRWAVGPMEQSAAPSGWPSAADRALVALLRAGAQSGSSRWPARLYAVLLYTPLAAVTVVNVRQVVQIGVNALAAGQTLMQAAFSSYFFGTMQALMLPPLVASLLGGRSRYLALLDTVRAVMDELAGSVDVKASHQTLTRRVWILLTAQIMQILLIPCMLYLPFKASINAACSHNAIACITMVGMSAMIAILQMCLFMIPTKFLYMTMVLGSGYSALNAELQSLAGGGELRHWGALARLRPLQDRLSGAFRRLVDDMAHELTLAMVTGVFNLVISLLVLFQAASSSALLLAQLPILFNVLVTAGLLIALPCEAGQQMLALAAATRDWLLRLRWESARVGQEVSALLEAARRDLEQLGDLGYYRLQRSTMVGVMSTIVTYVIVFVQFRTSGV
ncbi:hypothetical protein FJT64_003825 [Amphibalanus amphitrite]|uniref:Gustatory receptor n=1 Tax=Amphibalanus amphitrite TaxID=1232801 RepID=A0A6A4W4X7_AMPAM|nr:hypothetical protein FJT64_003825 [Amphibalanus amphitrite]